jgi:hypothetical protein
MGARLRSLQCTLAAAWNCRPMASVPSRRRRYSGTPPSAQHILTSKAVDPQQALAYDWAVGVALDDNRRGRAMAPLKYGGTAPGIVSHMGSATFSKAGFRTLPEVLKRSAHGGAPSLRAAVPGLDAARQAAVQDLEAKSVEEPKTERTTLLQGMVLGDARVKRILWNRCTSASIRDVYRGARARGTGASPLRIWVWISRLRLIAYAWRRPRRGLLFRVVHCVVRRMDSRVKPNAFGQHPHSALFNAQERCDHPLDWDGVHASKFKRGGYVLRRHDRVATLLWNWIEGRIGSEALIEQVPSSGGEPGPPRLDLRRGGQTDQARRRNRHGPHHFGARAHSARQK